MGIGAAQHNDFIPPRQNLGVLRGVGAGEQRQPAQHANERQVREWQGHGERSCWASQGRRCRVSTHGRCCSGATEFSAPACVLKWSGDDVEDRRHEACCTSDGGGPSGFAVQAEIPNHRKLRRLRAGVVSVAVKVSRVAGQVCDEKTNVCEPLLTHRNKQRRHRNRNVWGVPGQRRAFRGASSAGERPACGLGGARCIGGVSSSQALVWNRRTCRPDSDDRKCVRLLAGHEREDHKR